MTIENVSHSPDIFLKASALGLTYPGGHVALTDVTFALAKGEFVSIVGPSGCGKSTLLRLIGGLLTPTHGSLSMTESSEAGEARKRSRLSFVFQDHRLLPWRNAIENIRLPMEFHKVPRTVQDEQISASLRLFGLTKADSLKLPRMLSGGMRMRVSLARALAITPEVLLLDEPFGALDDILRQQLNEEVSRIWLQQRWNALFVTHNVTEAVFLSERIIVMSPHPGKIIKVFQVPFDYPRSTLLRGDAAFARLVGEVSACLRKGMN